MSLAVHLAMECTQFETYQSIVYGVLNCFLNANCIGELSALLSFFAPSYSVVRILDPLLDIELSDHSAPVFLAKSFIIRIGPSAIAYITVTQSYATVSNLFLGLQNR
jgi:hypothetical protein